MLSKTLLARGLILSGATVVLLSLLFFRTNLSPPSVSSIYPGSRARDHASPHHQHPMFDHIFANLAGEGEEERATNGRAMRALIGCLARDDCAQNQTGVVILASPKFGPRIEAHNNVEGAWALSVQNALQQLGYTYLWFPSLTQASATYALFPDLVKLVLAEGHDVAWCFDAPHCIKSPSNPTGFPVWKLFSLSSIGAVTGPLGGDWVLSPEDFHTGAQVLGYSIEDACRAHGFVRRSEREQHVYILGDRLSYWYHRDCAWDDGAFWGIRDAFFLEVTLVGGLVNDTQWDTYWPPYMDNYGPMSGEDYYSLLSHSQVLVGTGVPPHSPAPYEALCFGVPFINPILRWDEKRPFHRESWVTQHDGLKHLEPPYVYHVKKMDVDGLIKAVRTARATPIGRYIAPYMHQSALRQRLGELVEADWRTRAKDLLNRRVAALEGPLFEL